MFLAARPRFSELARSYVWLEGVSTDVVRGRSSMSHGAPTGPGCHFWPCCLLSRRLLFNFGDDYQLANYQQLAAYWAKLQRESDRLKVVEIGKTEAGEGRKGPALDRRRPARQRSPRRPAARRDGL